MKPPRTNWLLTDGHVKFIRSVNVRTGQGQITNSALAANGQIAGFNPN